MPAQSSPSQPLHAMFTAVPPHYDLINRIITLGMDRWWRHRAARECLAERPSRLLDVCCGTGDLAISVARLAGENIEIVGLDYSAPMLEIARAKARGISEGRKISFIDGDVSRLPFPEGHFDVAGISFAFRNLTYKNPKTEVYLKEIHRVLKPGGKFVIVESSQPKWGIMRALFRLYLRAFVFPMGYLLSGNKGAYCYLAESAACFYGPEGIEQLLKGVGFGQVRYRPLFFGAVGIHVGMRGW